MEKNYIVVVLLFLYTVQTGYCDSGSRKPLLFPHGYPAVLLKDHPELKHSEIRKRLLFPNRINPGSTSNSWNLDNISVLAGVEQFIEPVYESFPAYEFIPFSLSFKNLSEFDLWDGWLKLTYEFQFDEVFHEIKRYIIDEDGYLQQIIDDYEDFWYTDSKYEYNAEGRLSRKTVVQIDVWDSTFDTSAYKYEYAYTNDNVSEVIVYALNVLDSTWKEDQKYTYTYTIRGNLSEVVCWWESLGEWVKYYRSLYSYDSTGRQIECTAQIWDDVDSVWKNSEKGVFSYNADGKPDEYHAVEWDYDNDTIWYENLYQFDYNSEGEYKGIIAKERNPGDSTWENYLKYTFTYDSAANIEDEEISYWYEEKDNWTQEAKYVFSYNDRGNPDRATGYDWDTTSQDWQIADYFLSFAYSYTNAINYNSSLASSVPGMRVLWKQGKICVTVEGKTGKQDILHIYDLQGRLLYTARPVQVGNKYLFKWDVTGNTPANKVYLFSIVHNNRRITKRVILSR